jgi:hypothetical protein
MKDAKTLYERGYGIADLDHDIKITLYGLSDWFDVQAIHC